MKKEQEKIIEHLSKLWPHTHFKIKSKMGTLRLFKDGEVVAIGCATITRYLRSVACTNKFCSKYNRYSKTSVLSADNRL